MMRMAFAVVMSLVVAATAFAQTPRTYYDARTPADASLPPFSQSVLVGNTLYLSGMLGLGADREVPADVFNTVYRTYFTKEFPARAFIGSGALLYGARFELQGIAIKR